MSGGAHASSFVVLGAMEDKVGPSMLVLGESSPSITSIPDKSARNDTPPASAGERAQLSYPFPGGQDGGQIRISPSIIAMGSPAPRISYERIASITPDPPRPSPRPDSVPMVIRGGIVGDAFARSLPSPESVATPSDVAQQSDTGGSKGNPIPKPKEPEKKAPAPEPQRTIQPQ